MIRELNMRKADGTPLRVRLESIAFGGDHQRQCRTALIDLTSIKHARQLLEESEQRYRRLTDAVTDYEGPRLLSQGIELLLNLAGTCAATPLERFQLMCGVADQLSPVVASRMTGHLLSLIDHAHLGAAGTQHGRLAGHRRRRRVAVAVKLHTRMRVHQH